MTESKVSREEFLSILESVQSGLAQRESIEQSSCFVFKDGLVYTYNEEIACVRPSKLPKSAVGAVQAKNLLESLRKLPDESIVVELTDNQFVVKGKGRKIWVNLEKDIQLNIDAIGKGEKWNSLHEDFAEAVSTVAQCAGTDDDDFDTISVHIHPDYVEASDRLQICRWLLKNELENPVLVRASSIKHISTLGVTEFSETESWIHFRNEKGLTFSCHRFVYEDYPTEQLTKHLQQKGNKITLPKTLSDAVERAKIFSAEITDGNRVTVSLTNGKVSIKGEGVTGGFRETKKIGYSGDDMTMCVSPDMLIRIIREHDECIVVPNKMIRVDGGVYQYAACLYAEKKKEEESEDEVIEEKPKKKKIKEGDPF